MRVAIINNLYYPEERGGAEKIARLMADGLRKKGADVSVIATKSRKFSGVQEAGVDRLDSFFYHLDKMPKAIRPFWHLCNLFNLANYRRVKKIFSVRRPDIVITHNLMGLGFLLPRLFRKMGIRHIHVLHDIQLLHPSGLMIYGKEEVLEGFFSKVYRFFCRSHFGSPSTVVSPSLWLMNEHLRRGFFLNSEKMVAMNPVAAEIPSATKESSGTYLRFLFVGQIEKHKGVISLLEAFRAAKLKVGSCQLKIIGDGSLMPALRGAAKNDPDIILLGRREKSFVIDSMRNSDFLVMPSLCYENSPTVIYEAASVGLPSIASAIGGAPELIAKFGGLSFEPGNAGDLAEKMIQAGETGIQLKKIDEDLSIKSYLDKIGI